MRSGENREIGLVIHEVANPFNAEVISGLSDFLETEDYLVSVLDSQNDNTKEVRNLKAFIAGNRSGIIWVPTAQVLAETVNLLRTNNVPTITFLNSFTDSPFDHVGIKNAKATFDATTHIISLGHRNIAYFGVPARHMCAKNGCVAIAKPWQNMVWGHRLSGTVQIPNWRPQKRWALRHILM